MADTKITGLLSPQVTTNPATDVLPIVNIADTLMASSGSTRKITVNQLLGAGGTATLASATITGDLTVRTNKLAVTNIGVGFGTTSPIVPLDVRGTSGAAALFLRTTDPTAPVASAYIQSPVSTGFSSTVPIYGFWYQNCGMGNPAAENLSWIIGSGEAMRLNSTGLGVGVASPAAKLDVRGTVNGNHAIFTGTVNRGLVISTRSDGLADDRTVILNAQHSTGAQGQLVLQTVGADRLLIDSAGNVGVGVTPSAWGSNWKALDIQGGGRVYSLTGTGTHGFSFNAFNNNTNWLYQFSTAASRFELQQSGNFAWFTAPSGTAGNTITFTQAMTLTASGDLGVGITNPSFRLHALVSSGADRDIFAAQVLAASNGLQVKWNHATTTLRIILANIPTSSAGLATGTLWNDAGTIKIA